MEANETIDGVGTAARILSYLPAQVQVRLVSAMRTIAPSLAASVATTLLTRAQMETAPPDPFPIPRLENPPGYPQVEGAIKRKPARKLSQRQIQEMYQRGEPTECGYSPSKRSS